jgi:hypothetical protein
MRRSYVEHVRSAFRRTADADGEADHEQRSS